MRITKEYKFDAAHMLVGHEGKCARLHGHTYTVIVSIMAHALYVSGTSEGMVMDYGDLDKIVNPIIDAMDHRMLIKGDEPPYLEYQRALDTIPKHVAEYEAVARKVNDNFCVIGVRTTAENIAKYLFQKLEVQIRLQSNNVMVSSVEVRETPKTSAVYHGI